MTYPHSTIDDIYTKHNNPISIIRFTTSASSEYYTFESRIFKESSRLIFRLFFGGYQHIIENIVICVNMREMVLTITFSRWIQVFKLDGRVKIGEGSG